MRDGSCALQCTTDAGFEGSKNNLHLALGGVLRARDIKGIKINMVAINRLDDEHLWWRREKKSFD